MASPVPKFQYRRGPVRGRWNDIAERSRTARASQGKDKAHFPPIFLFPLSPPHHLSFVQRQSHARSFPMVSMIWLPSLAFLALTIPIAKGQRNTCAPDEPGRRGGECIKRNGRGYASAFCSSFLPITTPVQTSFTTVTEYRYLV